MVVLIWCVLAVHEIMILDLDGTSTHERSQEGAR
jgi:hypothetical protein